MALEGTLREFSLADIFQLIGLQRKTGILTLSGSLDTVSVTFEKGAIVGAESESKRLEDRLGAVLLKTGKVSRPQLNRILQQQKESGRRIGDLLVHGEALEPRDLERALALQVTQIIYRLFRWSEGTFRFAQTTLVDYDRECFRPIAVENILMEGMRILDEWPLIERRVQSFDMVFEPSDGERLVRRQDGDPDDLDDDLDDALGLEPEESSAESEPEFVPCPDEVVLSAAEWTAYTLLDGSRTVQDVIDRSDLGEFETCKALFELLERDLIRQVSHSAAESPQGRRRIRAAVDRAMATAAALLGAGALLGGLAVQATSPEPVVRALAPYTATDGAVDALRLAASQSRLARLDFAVRLYALYRQAYPGSLDRLAEMGLLAETDLTDPWGRRYDYILTRRSYQIRGSDGEGRERADLILTGRIPLDRSPALPLALKEGILPAAR